MANRFFHFHDRFVRRKSLDPVTPGGRKGGVSGGTLVCGERGKYERVSSYFFRIAYQAGLLYYKMSLTDPPLPLFLGGQICCIFKRGYALLLLR